MDVESLRSELERHLGNNPDKDAPDGFRDRFEGIVDEFESGNDHVPREVRETQLQQICKEAEAAAAAGRHDTAGDTGSRPPDRTPDDDEPGGRVIDAAPAPSGDTLRRFGLPIVVILVLIVTALVFLR
jgi:hypothetical protein